MAARKFPKACIIKVNKTWACVRYVSASWLLSDDAVPSTMYVSRMHCFPVGLLSWTRKQCWHRWQEAQPDSHGRRTAHLYPGTLHHRPVNQLLKPTDGKCTLSDYKTQKKIQERKQTIHIAERDLRRNTQMWQIKMAKFTSQRLHSLIQLPHSVLALWGLSPATLDFAVRTKRWYCVYMDS